MVKRVACFLTCGYTEAGAMQSFLTKINSSFEYKQYLPNRTVKKKGYPKNISSSVNGLTGEKLLEKVYSIVEKHSKELSSCAAILIEDDVDDRFFGWTEEKVDDYNQSIRATIGTKLGRDIPVFILYAAPEIESWFVTDWENGFQYLYCDVGFVNDVERNARKFFAHHLKQYVEREILREYKDNIERYGIFEGNYIKLSDQLKEAIQTDSKQYMKRLTGTNENYVNQILCSGCLYYSKKLHGDRMLRNISPEIVEKGCFRYFKNTYHALREFSLIES